MTLLEARAFVAQDDPVLARPSCAYCGEPASVKRWYATPPSDTPDFYCGGCALSVMGDTVGVIASVVLEIGADS